MKRNSSPAPSTLLAVLLLGLPSLPSSAQAPARDCKMALGQGHHEVRRAQNKKALELFREALGDVRCAGEAQLGLATAYNADNDHKEAIQAAEAALRLLEEPELLAESHYQIGLALDRRGARMNAKKEQAVKAFEQALELSDGEHRGAVRALLRIFKETHDEERQAALEARFPGVRVATRAEQRRALKPKKKPASSDAEAVEESEELPEWEPVGAGDAYDCATLEPLATGEFEERAASFGPDGPQEIAQGSELTRPEKLKAPQPYFTEEARKNRVQGTVIVQTLIDVDGTIPFLRIVEGLPYGLNDKTARAMCQWEFEPARDASGQPVAVYYNLTVNFRLQ